MEYNLLMAAMILGSGMFGHVVHAQSAKKGIAPMPTFASGDIVTHKQVGGGCPTFDGMVDVLMATLLHEPARDLMIKYKCIRLEPGIRLRVIDVSPTHTIVQVEPPDFPGEDRLFVFAGGLSHAE